MFNWLRDWFLKDQKKSYESATREAETRQRHYKDLLNEIQKDIVELNFKKEQFRLNILNEQFSFYWDFLEFMKLWNQERQYKREQLNWLFLININDYLYHITDMERQTGKTTILLDLLYYLWFAKSQKQVIMVVPNTRMMINLRELIIKEIHRKKPDYAMVYSANGTASPQHLNVYYQNQEYEVYIFVWNNQLDWVVRGYHANYVLVDEPFFMENIEEKIYDHFPTSKILGLGTSEETERKQIQRRQQERIKKSEEHQKYLEKQARTCQGCGQVFDNQEQVQEHLEYGSVECKDAYEDDG